MHWLLNVQITYNGQTIAVGKTVYAIVKGTIMSLQRVSTIYLGDELSTSYFTTNLPSNAPEALVQESCIHRFEELGETVFSEEYIGAIKHARAAALQPLRDAAELQQTYAELRSLRKMTKQKLCDTLIPFRDKYALTDMQTMRIAAGTMPLMALIELLEEKTNGNH